MTKYRKGSAGAAEQKTERAVMILGALVTIGIILAWFVFPTDQHLFVKRASLLANISGFIVLIGAAVWLALGAAFQWDGKNCAKAWLILLVLGICLSTGFNFDYFGV